MLLSTMSRYTALAPHGTTLDKTHVKVLVNIKEKGDQSSLNVEKRGLCAFSMPMQQPASANSCFALQCKSQRDAGDKNVCMKMHVGITPEG